MKQLNISFGFYGEEEVTVASESEYVRLVLAVFSQYLLLILIRLFSSFTFSTGTSTCEGYDLVDLELEKCFLGP